MAGNRNRKDPQFRNMGLATTAGTLLVSSIIIGYVGGSWLDTKLKTEPVFMAVGVLLGMVAGFIELLKMVQRITGGPTDRRNK